MSALSRTWVTGLLKSITLITEIPKKINVFSLSFYWAWSYKEILHLLLDILNVCTKSAWKLAQHKFMLKFCLQDQVLVLSFVESEGRTKQRLIAEHFLPKTWAKSGLDPKPSSAKQGPKIKNIFALYILAIHLIHKC